LPNIDSNFAIVTKQVSNSSHSTNSTNSTSGEHLVHVLRYVDYFAITHCSFQSADNHFNSRFLEVWNGLNDNQQTRLSLSLQILTTVQGDDAPSVGDHVFDTLEVLLRTNDLFDEGHVNHMSSFVAMSQGLAH
jgi:hypothetical protein